jgi:alkane 1-monooxygenase
MPFLNYFTGFVVPMVVATSLILEGWMTFFSVVFFFTFIPLVELIATGTTENLPSDEESGRMRDRKFSWVLYSMVPIQFALIGLYLWRITTFAPSPVEWVGLTMSLGMSCGILGINVGHELGHRRKKFEQVLAKSLLLSSMYTHFFIEHNRGHHTHVATENDPATSRYGESLYRFFPRTIIGSWVNAWKLEVTRLGKQNKGPWTWKNEMIRLQTYQVLFAAGIGVAFGLPALLGFLGAAAVGGLLLETVNYIEHYGLARKRRADGSFERVLPIHSWNSNHTFGRAVLFDLTRHSDHHAHARRPYQVLRHFDESPQLPTGYPGMMTLAWFPPLFFAVMHRHIAKHQAMLDGRAPDQLRPQPTAERERSVQVPTEALAA